jgi:5-methyltetrahydropteroyltriglutamate--homocysteine methyltransferase
MELLEQKYTGKPYDEAAYDVRLKGSVTEIVRKQIEIGIDVPSDGEFGKSGFNHYPVERLTGFTPREGPPERLQRGGRDREVFRDFYTEYDKLQPMTGNVLVPMACTGQITYRSDLLERDLANFQSALAGSPVEEAFYPAIAPWAFQGRSNQFYRSEAEYLGAIADALKTEYRMIVDAGFLLQIDAPIGSDAYDGTAESLADCRRQLAADIELLNHALAGIPEDRVRYHFCWGSWHGPHKFDIPMKGMIDIVLEANVQAISLEAANPAHEHEYEDWEDIKLPEGKLVLPGVVTHSTNIIEHPRVVAQRIERYARAVGRENVIASTDCGFSQGAFSAKVHPSIAWAKLESLVEGAQLATQRLWS